MCLELQIMESNERNRERVSHRLFTRIRSPHHMILRTLQDLRRAGGDHEAEEILIPYEDIVGDSGEEESEDDDEGEGQDDGRLPSGVILPPTFPPPTV